MAPIVRSAALIAKRRALIAARQRLVARTYATPVTTHQEKDPQLGDYPQLPEVSRQHLPPTGWWDNQTRRNYGDTVRLSTQLIRGCFIETFFSLACQLHEQEELYSMWGPDVPSIPPKTAVFQFGIAASVFLGLALIANALTPERDSIPREYPYSGLVKELGGLEENKVCPQMFRL